MKRLLKLPTAYYLVPVAYLTLAAVWIVLSDTLLARYAGLLSPAASKLSIVKGLAFIAFTTAFLFFLVSRHVRLVRTFKLDMKRILRKMNTFRVDYKHRANELDAILNNSLVGIGFVDSDMVFRRVNKSFTQIMECGEKDFLGRNVLGSPNCVLCFSLGVYIAKCERDGEPIEVEFKADFPGGVSKWLQVSITKVKAVGKMNGYVVLLRDISLRKENEEKIVYLSHHDFLTSLPNRRFFNDKLEDACKFARRYKESFCVLFMDINNFKQYNDQYGHEFGDAILREFARIVREGLRESDVLARIGGDEFAAIVRGVGERELGRTVADKLQARLAAVGEIYGEKVSLSASIGLSVFPQDGSCLDELLNVADRNMYFEKDLFRKNAPEARQAAGTERKAAEAERESLQSATTH